MLTEEQIAAIEAAASRRIMRNGVSTPVTVTQHSVLALCEMARAYLEQQEHAAAPRSGT